jgi:hypothetical protein
MSTITTIVASPTGFSYDVNKIEYVGGSFQLKLVNNPNQTITEDFADDTGFDYCSDSIEFSGGQIQQKSQFPSDSTCGMNFTSSIDMSYGDGVLTGTASGGAAVSGGKLNLKGGTVKYVSYDADLNADSQQTGAFRFKVTPNYSGNAPSTQVFMACQRADGDSKNQILLMHLMNGQFRVSLQDLTGSVTHHDLGAWSPTLGTEYEIEFNYDFTAGASRLFIDGTQFGITMTTTQTRDANIAFLRLGTLSNQTIDCELDDFQVFSAVQHTANYTAGYSVPEYQYAACNPTSPTYPIAGPGEFQSVDGFTATEGGTPRYTALADYGAGFVRYWHTGGEWVVSDGTYAQANTQADFNAGLADWPITGLPVDLKLGMHFEDSNTQGYISSMELEYTDQIYPTDNPTITPASTFPSSLLKSFEDDSSAAGSDAVKYTISASGQERYVTGGSASDSDGTYAQSSTAAEMESDIENIITTRKTSVFPKIFLHSDDGTTTPTFTFITIEHDQSILNISAGTLCNFDGAIYDKDGPIASEIVRIRPYEGFINGNVLHKYEWQTLGTTDANGWFAGDIYVQSADAYWEMKVGKQRYKFQLPNAGEATFANLESFEVIEAD